MNPAAGEPSKTMETRTIVVCDDDATLTSILQHILGKKKGFKVMVAGDGEDGWILVRELRPDLLILDLEMPVKGGLAVLRDMNSLPGRHPYTIVLSATESPETQEKAKALGAGEFMTKPFKPADILTRIDHLIESGII